MGSVWGLVAVSAFGILLAAYPGLSAGQDLPWWAMASLVQDDVGPDFDLTRAELSTQDAFATYLVQFDRRTSGPSGGMTSVGSLLIRNDGGPADISFDTLAATVVRQRTGLGAVEGPPVGTDVRWYVGPWGEPPGEDEAHVLVWQIGGTVASVAVVGQPGAVRQEQVVQYATLVSDRLARLAPSPTPTVMVPTDLAPEPTAIATPEAERTPVPFPPTPTEAPRRATAVPSPRLGVR